mmetsp:Transcript_23849/g.44277  ORF Transcript_23849/g.44277 Transcript_23849/m.44277 type:complete len:81 (+) Transcript_23849:85-327(+)
MASSRQTRLRSNKYNDNITKRGNVPIGVAERREQGYSVGPILLGFLVFVVCGSTFFPNHSHKPIWSGVLSRVSLFLEAAC